MTTGTLKEKLQTGTPEHKLRPGQKWRPGHRDTGNINDDHDTQREITDWDTNDNRDTGNMNDQLGHRETTTTGTPGGAQGDI